MEEKKSYKSWTISDAFWEAVKENIPERRMAIQFIAFIAT